MVGTEDTQASMNTQTWHTPENQDTSTRSPTRPRILFVVDAPNWAHDFKTENIKRVLGNDYEIQKRYQTDLTEEDLDQADLILVYYWLQFESLLHLAPAFRRNRNRLLVGISSNWELESERREPGLATLIEFGRAVFVNSQILYRQYQTVFDMSVFYTPNGVDVEFYQPPLRKERSSRLRVGWTGSLTNFGGDYKGYQTIIVPAVKALEGAELVTAAREDKWRSPDEMRDFYRSLDVYVCASLGESAPNPCLEAAACGVPLVTTRVGTMPELVRDGINGFFVGRDIQNVADKLCLLRDDIALRTSMAQRIRQDIQSWDWSIRAQAYREMFEVALSRETDFKHFFVGDNGNHLPSVIETQTAGAISDDELRVEQLREALTDKARRNLALLPGSFFEGRHRAEITIVMLSHGRLKQTTNALYALKKNVQIPFELVLIDNNSGVEIQNKLKEFCAGLDFVNLVLLAENLGCAGGRMYGLNYVTTEFVMFLDNDVEVLPGTVEHLLHSLQSQPEIVAASGNIILPNGAVHLCGADYWTENEILFYELLEAGKRFDEPGIGESGPVRWTSGGATLIRKSVLVDNPFDVSMKAYYEDLEWCYRLNQKGVGCFYKNVAALALHHHEPVSFDELDAVEERRRQSAPYIETIAWFYKTHGKIIQNLFDFVPELGSPADPLSISSAKIFLELVNTQGCQWTIDKWNYDELVPLFLAQPLSSRIAEQERIILTSEQRKTELELAFQQRETELKLAFRQRETELEAQLERITKSLGWRLLNYYGPIKYRFVLPAYKSIKKILRGQTAP